jgi:hypothetical protein
MDKYRKGSQWRIWDLHIHTPDTKKEDKFTGSDSIQKWENYVQSINESDKEISVIGITDYFSIENYFVFKDKIKTGEINKQFDLILPNIELRIHPVTAKGKAINIHCLFNPLIEEDIETQFLSKLSMPHGGTTYNATKKDLIRFGKALNEGRAIDDKSAYKKGISEYVISFDVLKGIFDVDKKLKNNTIIVVANGNDGVSNLKKHSDFFIDDKSMLNSLIESIYQFSDAIFSSRLKDREYFLGERADSEDEVIKKLRSLKPCYHGCDAHENQKIFNPDGSRFCWIKSNPTFNGLKQTLYEPGERVMIQPTIYENKTDYQVIDKIIINNELVQNSEIELNEGLNCIIGGRSTGKSILLSAITKKLQPNILVKSNKPKYEKLVQGISDSLQVIWKDGNENNSREIEFFYQGYMIPYSRSIDRFDELVKSILEDKTEGNLFELFDDFIIRKKTELQGDINIIFSLIDKIYSKKQTISDIGDIAGIDAEILKIKILIKTSKEGLDFSEEDYQLYHQKKDRNSLIKERIEKLRLDQIILNEMPEESLIKPLRNFNTTEEIKERIITLYDNSTLSFIANWKNGIEEIKKIIIEEIRTLGIETQLLEKDDIYIKGEVFLNQNQALLELENKLLEEQSKKEKNEKLQIGIKKLTDELFEKKQNVISTHKFFYLKAQEVSDKLSRSFEDLEIKAYPRFLEDKYSDLLGDSINLQSHDRQQMASFKYTSNEMYEAEIKSKLELLLDDKIQLKNSYTNRTLIERIIADSFYVISYEVTYESDKYKDMSEGKQAFVVLKLLLDFSDKKCPILIDQPEDDLDNRAIYNDLVKYLKKKKKERQIILVTHNPNIVVGTDSELVIVANQHGVNNKNRGNKKFQYITGSIENSFGVNKQNDVVLERQGIREHICEILEGGENAFKKREKRYGIKDFK